MDNNAPQLIILDLGSQYTQVIGRELLKLGHKNIIFNTDSIKEYLKNNKPKGIILSGGAASVYDTDAPDIPEEIFKVGCPILGICYGMHYIAYREDKSLVSGGEKQAKEYGPIEVALENSALFKGVPQKLKVWASHGDSVQNIPKGYSVTARSGNTIEAMENIEKGVYAVQFHPEVIETEDNNLILKNFAENICGALKDWEAGDAITEIREDVLKKVGNGLVAIGVSGGVDSTTLAALLAPVMKDKLYAFLIDTGGARQNEIEEVKNTCKRAGISLHVIEAQEEFFKNLADVTDAEEKRAKFKETYKSIYKKVIEENKATHILQGTLATDLIESGSLGNAKTIKSHHNVGLDFGVEEISPFAGHFKHEVRDIARAIGLEKEISERKPFPGPGLFVRVVGTPVTPELVEKLRLADNIVTEILKKDPIYAEISQVVVALLGVKTVGVQGDGRTYGYPIVVRCISSTDFMTIKGVELPSELRKSIISEITKHGFNRVFFDETPKPPATTELE
jgi:GMP synthase (glutamine-hydrolysing)